LRPDVWTAFAARFAPGRILEFYAATEGNIMLVNFDSQRGAIGRIPAWMDHKFIVKLVRFDILAQEPVRDAAGRCIECATGEIGEAIGRILDDSSRTTSRFEGYAESAANERKILRGAFAPGDAWFRSGDLMRRDAQGYFYFADRIGDTFRWKGENVSTIEVAETIATFPGVRQVLVYGVEVAGTEGRAGMAALVVDDPSDFWMDGFQTHLAAHLPDYARPLFLRFTSRLPATSTFKPRRIELMAEGFDPARIGEPIFFNDPHRRCFVPLDRDLYRQILGGEWRL
jgi:fatty-acyl-CoA synthase